MINKNWKNMKCRGAFSGLAFAAIISTLIITVYDFVIPTFFPGHKAGWVLHLGVFLATLIGGYIGFYQANESRFSIRLTLGFCYAGVMAILVYVVSLFFILNVRGS